MNESNGTLARFADGWVQGGMLMVLPLLLLVPLVEGGPVVRLAVLALPVYALHQYEEHDRGRFGAFVATMVGPRFAGLSRVDILFVNVALVWLPLALAAFLAAKADPAFALFAAYLLLINAVTHIVAAVRLRGPNPGLWTAIVLFVPLGGALVSLTPAGVVAHLVAAGVVVLLHLALVLRALRPAR